MSSHSLGVVLLKVMGLFFALDVALGIMGIVSSLSDPLDVPGISFSAVLAFQIMTVVVTAVFSSVLLVGAGRVAGWLFPVDDGKTAHSIEARQALGIGISLVGVYLVASNLSNIVGFAGELIWYLEGSRQDFVPDFWTATWRESVPRIGSALLGGILCLRSNGITSFLWRPWRGEPNEDNAVD